MLELTAIEHKGARISVELGDGHARLLINGLVREQQTLDPASDVAIRLSSTVQTEYEWHESIDALIRPSGKHFELSLTANAKPLINTQFKLDKVT